MPKRYVCRKCSFVKEKKDKCFKCGEELEEVVLPWTWETFLPYIFAGIGGVFILLSYLLDNVLFIWLTFPLIIAGLAWDHFYQKRVDERAKKMMENKQ